MKRAAADYPSPEASDEEEDEEMIKYRLNMEIENRVMKACIFYSSKHRDGSIYKGGEHWHRRYRVADTRENSFRHIRKMSHARKKLTSRAPCGEEAAKSTLEPMMLSAPTDCQPNRWNCRKHSATNMMQIFSLKLANVTTAADGPVQLYGFVAVRDLLAPLRIDFSDGDYSDIPMVGPKRGIFMLARVLMEFDIRIKGTGRKEDDLQQIDGVTTFCEITSINCRPYTKRIEGDCGAIDVTASIVRRAVEGTIQVEVSEVQGGSGMNLSLYSTVNKMEPKIRHFQGVIAEPCVLNRFVVAAVRQSALVVFLDVDQRGGTGRARPRYAFKARLHGEDVQEFRLGFATIVVKVTWSTL
ncbi:hypothetical protein ACP4OV_014856 [Aristida adscensionis]